MASSTPGERLIGALRLEPDGRAWERSGLTGSALLLTSLATLLLEVALTRVFSVVFFYHYAFLAISIALLGLAGGGLMARLGRGPAADARRRNLGVACLAACLTLIPVLHIVLETNVWLVTTWIAFRRLALVFIACMVPFVLAGFVIASVMSAGWRRAASLYGFDLVGAALGCLLFVPVVNALGGPNAILVAGLLWAVAAVVWGWTAGRGRTVATGGLVAAGVAGLILANRGGAVFDIEYSRGQARKAEVFARWNSFSRVSVFRNERGLYWLEIDGAGGSWVSNVDVSDSAQRRVVVAQNGMTGPGLVYRLRPQPRTLIIGPGGGAEIGRALAAGSPSVAVVEINPIIARDIMLGRFRTYSHDLYARPEVRVFVEDGRTFVERTRSRYDVIQLSLVDTWAASASGGYALTENFLYTVDAFEAYLRRLTDRGVLSVTRWEFRRPRETLRLASVALAALERLHVQRPADHVIVVLDKMSANAALRMGTILVGRLPFSPAAVRELVQRAPGTPVEVAYAPGLDRGIYPFPELIRSDRRAAFFRRYEFDVTPVYDDRPFFFFMSRWRAPLAGAFRFDPSGDSLNTGAQLLLLGLLGFAAAAALLVLFVPLVAAGRSLRDRRLALPFLAFALAVGLGYILVEMALIQRLVVFLGNPAYSLTVVLFSLLLASGLGSRWSERYPVERLVSIVRRAAAGIVLLVLAHWLLVPWLLHEGQGAAQGLKVPIAALAVAPLGALMGVPFPSGLRLAGRRSSTWIEWIWAVNAAATVLGSVAAVMLSVRFGISTALWLGGACYIVAAAALAAGAAAVAADDSPGGRLRRFSLAEAGDPAPLVLGPFMETTG